MGKSLILAVKIIGDANSALAAMDQVAGKSDRVGSALGTASKWGIAALAGITGAAIVAGKSASDLEQATGAVASVFGEYAGKMNKLGEEAATAVGLSQTEYGNSAAVLGAQLKNMGMDIETAAGQTDSLIGLGSDLAATFGGSTSDAVAALSSLLRGERDPIEKYGISIKAADVEAQKAAMGLSGLTGEAAKAADTQATLALLTAQSADAQGQFARESDSAAGSAQIAAAQYENAKAALGEALLPIMTEASAGLADLANWFKENAEWVTPLVGVIGGLAAAIVVINAAYTAFTAVQAIQTTAQWASNAAWLASPITWIILAVIAAIALLVVAIIWVVENWDLIKAKAVEVWEAVIGWIKQAVSWLTEKIGAAIMWVVNAWVQIQIKAAMVWAAIIDWIKQAIAWLGDRLMAPIRGALAMFENLKAGAIGVFQSIINWVKNAIDWIANLASNAIPGWAKDLMGMSRMSMMVEPQLLGFETPQFAARMLINPELAAFDQATTYGVAAPVSAPAPQQFASLAAVTQQFSAPQNKRAQNSEPTVIDQSKHEYNFPNYTGTRAELIDWIQEALSRRAQRTERLIRA